jgi:hypothetical protein
VQTGVGKGARRRRVSQFEKRWKARVAEAVDLKVRRALSMMAYLAVPRAGALHGFFLG